MADSSGNLKLLVGAVLGAGVAAGVVLMTRPAPPPPPPPTAPATAPAAAAPEAPPPEAPPPKPATQAADWRGKVEVGETGPVDPRPQGVPTTASEVRDFLASTAKHVGGPDALAKLSAAEWRLDVTLQGWKSNVVARVSAEGVWLEDRARHLRAVWKPGADCTVEIGPSRRPCTRRTRALVLATYAVHAGHILGLAGKLKPSGVTSGMGARVAWVGVGFQIGAKHRVITVHDTVAKRVVALTLAGNEPKIDDAPPGGAEDAPLPDKPTEGGKAVVTLPLGKLGPVVSLGTSAWLTVAGDVMVPSLWCLTSQVDGLAFVDAGEAKPVACEQTVRVTRVRPLEAPIKLALGDARDGVAYGSRVAHRVVQAPVTPATMNATSQKMEKAVGEPHLRPASALLRVEGQQVWLALEVDAETTKGVNTIPPADRVARTVVSTSVADLPKAFAAFEAKVKAAGAKPVPGARLARPDFSDKPDPTSTMKMMLELPVAVDR